MNELRTPEVDVPEHVWDAVLEVATIQRCHQVAQEKTGWDVATLVQEVVEATVAAMRGGLDAEGCEAGLLQMRSRSRARA
jgi:hypothetical protein